MGRPKGSKNKPKLAEIAEAPAGPDFVTMTLTEADLAPIRERQAAYARAAAKYKREHIHGEIRRRDLGEISDLSVPQVVPFDLPAEYHAAALKKAKASGLAGITGLRKVSGAWVFEGLSVDGLREVLRQRALDNEGAQAAANARLEARLEKTH